MSFLGLFGGDSSSSTSSTAANTSEAQNSGVATAPIITASGAVNYTNEFPAAVASAFEQLAGVANNANTLAGKAIETTQQTQQVQAQPGTSSLNAYAPVLGLVAIGFFVMEIFIHRKG